jgi:hypothetical protein
MKKVMVPLILCLMAHLAMAQKIELYKKFGGVRFMRGDTLLSERQVSMILFKDNKPAYDQLKKAKKFTTFSSILGFAGGALIAVPVITVISGGTPEWWLAAGGAASIIASIPVNRIYKSRTLDALDTYNGAQPTSRIQPSLYFSGTRAGLIIKF